MLQGDVTNSASLAVILLTSSRDFEISSGYAKGFSKPLRHQKVILGYSNPVVGPVLATFCLLNPRSSWNKLYTPGSATTTLMNPSIRGRCILRNYTVMGLR